MKKILFCISALVLCVSFSLTSCSKIQEKKAREQFVQDSIRHAEDSIKAAQIRAAFVADSLENVRLKALSEIAWGQIKFGMSYKEVLANEVCAHSKKQYSKDHILLSSEDVQNLTSFLGLKYGIQNVFLIFKEDELCSIQMKSRDFLYNATIIEDIAFDMKKISNSFTSKYGEPKKTYGSVQSRDFVQGKENTYASWDIKSKWMTILFGESSDRRYYYRLVISNSDYPKKN